MRDEELLNGWMPYRLIVENGAVRFRWFYAGIKRFTEPFFDESVSACLSFPENGRNHPTPLRSGQVSGMTPGWSGSFPVTSAEELIHMAHMTETLPVAGFIYHVSRCGSTLLSQMLVCDQQNIVLSEVPLLDEILRLRFRKEVADHPPIEELFKAALTLLGRKRNNGEQRVFVKTDSWHVLFYDELRQWYPDVRSLLLFRSPKEVAASHAQSPAMHAVPGLVEAELFGLDAEAVVHMQRESYLEHVLCTYLRKYAAVLAADDKATALDYHSGPGEMMQRLLLHCNLSPSREVLEAMKTRTSFHSKKTESAFTGDKPRPGVKHDFHAAEELFRSLQANYIHSTHKAHGT